MLILNKHLMYLYGLSVINGMSRSNPQVYIDHYGIAI
jgi:hypothetical protein